MRSAGITAPVFASLMAWLLLMPPLSVTPAGKTKVDTGASLSNWETVSSHPDAAQCARRRDQLRAQVEKAASENQPGLKSKPGKDSDSGQVAFAILRQRIAAARCVAGKDPRLHPATPPRTP